MLHAAIVIDVIEHSDDKAISKLFFFVNGILSGFGQQSYTELNRRTHDHNLSDFKRSI